MNRAKIQKPTLLQMRSELKHLGLAIPTTEKKCWQIFSYLGWPTPDPVRLRAFRTLHEKWVGKKVVGGANKHCPDRHAKMSGTVLAIVPRSPREMEEWQKVRKAYEDADKEIDPDARVGLFEISVKWDDGSTPSYLALCYFAIIEEPQPTKTLTAS